MTTTSVGTMIQTWISDVGTVLSDNLPAVLVVAAALFGLVIIVRYARRFIAGGR